MNTPAFFAIASAREHAAAFCLAAMVTLGLLASVGGMADQQYVNALVAHAEPALNALRQA